MSHDEIIEMICVFTLEERKKRQSLENYCFVNKKDRLRWFWMWRWVIGSCYVRMKISGIRQEGISNMLENLVPETCTHFLSMCHAFLHKLFFFLRHRSVLCKKAACSWAYQNCEVWILVGSSWLGSAVFPAGFIFTVSHVCYARFIFLSVYHPYKEDLVVQCQGGYEKLQKKFWSVLRGWTA